MYFNIRSCSDMKLI